MSLETKDVIFNIFPFFQRTLHEGNIRKTLWMQRSGLFRSVSRSKSLPVKIHVGKIKNVMKIW